MSPPVISVAENGLLSDNHRFEIKGKKSPINNCAVDTKLTFLKQASLMPKGPLQVLTLRQSKQRVSVVLRMAPGRLQVEAPPAVTPKARMTLVLWPELVLVLGSVWCSFSLPW